MCNVHKKIQPVQCFSKHFFILPQIFNFVCQAVPLLEHCGCGQQRRCYRCPDNMLLLLFLFSLHSPLWPASNSVTTREFQSALRFFESLWSAFLQCPIGARETLHIIGVFIILLFYGIWLSKGELQCSLVAQEGLYVSTSATCRFGIPGACMENVYCSSFLLQLGLPLVLWWTLYSTRVVPSFSFFSGFNVFTGFVWYFVNFVLLNS